MPKGVLCHNLQDVTLHENNLIYINDINLHIHTTMRPHFQSDNPHKSNNLEITSSFFFCHSDL